MNEDEVAGEKGAEDQKGGDYGRRELRDEDGEKDGSQTEGGEKGGSVAMVEEMAEFKINGGCGLVMERLRVEEAISGVQHPHGEEHGGETDGRKAKGGLTGDEGGPERSDGRGIEREKVPEMEQAEGRRSKTCG